MPVYSRQVLRQEAAQQISDVAIQAVGSGQGVAAGASVYFLDPTIADPSGSGQSQDLRAYVYHPSTGVTYRCSSFNFPSGAWVTAQLAATTVGSGDTFEVYRLLSPKDWNLCVDRTVQRLRTRQEVPIPSIQAARFYSLDAAASPQTIKTVLEAYYWANPAATDNRDIRYFDWFGVETTATTNQELRVRPAIAGSLTIIVDAILDVTLASADSATINFAHNSPIVWGAVNQAYEMVVSRAPGQEAGRYQQRRMEAAAMWNALSAKFMPMVDRRIMFDEDPSNKLKQGSF